MWLPKEQLVLLVPRGGINQTRHKQAVRLVMQVRFQKLGQTVASNAQLVNSTRTCHKRRVCNVMQAHFKTRQDSCRAKHLCVSPVHMECRVPPWIWDAQHALLANTILLLQALRALTAKWVDLRHSLEVLLAITAQQANISKTKVRQAVTRARLARMLPRLRILHAHHVHLATHRSRQGKPVAFCARTVPGPRVIIPAASTVRPENMGLATG